MLCITRRIVYSKVRDGDVVWRGFGWRICGRVCLQLIRSLFIFSTCRLIFMLHRDGCFLIKN